MTNAIIVVRTGEPIEKAIRSLRKAVEKDGCLMEFKHRREFEKPSEAKRRRARVVATRRRKMLKRMAS
jgi:small subunit ribosomal protein S21